MFIHQFVYIMVDNYPGAFTIFKVNNSDENLVLRRVIEVTCLRNRYRTKYREMYV